MGQLNIKGGSHLTCIWRYVFLFHFNSKLTTIQLWLKGTTSPMEIREKAKADPDFQNRLLKFITHVASETLPVQPPVSVSMEEEFQQGSRAFQPLLNPDYPHFDDHMEIDVYDIVTQRNMHNQNHTLTCFKYGQRYGQKRCRARFPRKLIASTQMDPETGVIEIERDNEWLNGYNKWFSLMTHANHDCQFLFTKDHALSIIYYIMKYISKPEAALHTKLTIAAAVRDAIHNNLNKNRMSDVDITKSFLIKTYNKLDTQREVGVPEAISHLLNISDHYTEGVFERLHTSHLLQYVKQFDHHELEADQDQLSSENEQDGMLDSQLIVNNKSYAVISPFDDYAYRGLHLKNLCLYDYCSMVYKSRGKGGIGFTSEHPQHKSHQQFVRQESYAIPNLLGRLLFVSKSSKDSEKTETYYHLVCWIFIPWSYEKPHVMEGQSWEEFYIANRGEISPRLSYHINNLDLLHKSKEESQIDVLQQKAKSNADAMDSWTDDQFLDNENNDEDSDATISSGTVVDSEPSNQCVPCILYNSR